jgi:hypothetical protein
MVRIRNSDYHFKLKALPRIHPSHWTSTPGNDLVTEGRWFSDTDTKQWQALQ